MRGMSDWVLQLKLFCCLDVRRQASSSLQAAKISCRHLSEAFELAVQQRFAHEYDDTETEKHWYARQTALGTAFSFTAKPNEFPERQAAGNLLFQTGGETESTTALLIRIQLRVASKTGSSQQLAWLTGAAHRLLWKRTSWFPLMLKSHLWPTTKTRPSKGDSLSLDHTLVTWSKADIWDQTMLL